MAWKQIGWYVWYIYFIHSHLAYFVAGHEVVQVNLVFRFVAPRGIKLPRGIDTFLAYVQRFDIVSQYQSNGRALGPVPHPVTGQYALRRSLRSDGSHQGGIIQVSHIRTAVSLVPCFQKELNARLNRDNSMDSFS